MTQKKQYIKSEKEETNKYSYPIPPIKEKREEIEIRNETQQNVINEIEESNNYETEQI